MRHPVPAPIFACLALGMLFTLPAAAETPARVNTPGAPVAQPFAPVPDRVVGRVDDSFLVTLKGNTHPMARSKYDQGLLEPSKLLERIVLTLKRSPEQEQALADFNERQYTPGSPDFHHWLEPEEFGKLYGPSDNDITAVSSWLENHGFRVERVSKGRVTLEFTGTVEQVQSTFHVEMHKYLVNGEQHIANDRDPRIPAALFPVVTGIYSLHDFFPKPQVVFGPKVIRDMKTGRVSLADPKPPVNRSGPHPELGYQDVNSFIRMDVAPADFAKIYNEDPLFTASTPINGKGVTIAIDGVSDVQTSDFNSFRSAFGLPAQTLKTIIAAGSTDPGFETAHGGEGENTLDVEWSGATAPGAQIELIVSSSTSTTPSVLLSPMYIIDNKVAPIMSASYGGCELGIGTAGNTTFNNLWQQGATQGISLFESSGDQGSAGCTSQDTAPPNADSIGLQVNGEASPPWITAVGGTDLNWNWWNDLGTPPAWQTYWATSNGAGNETALGYIPEIPWNSTCTSTILLNDVFVSGSTPDFTSAEGLCNAANGDPNYGGLIAIGAGSGGPSHCTTSDGNTPASCTGGYAKPSWQAGVTGNPADGHRDVPDVALMAAGAFLTTGDLASSSLIYCYDQGGTAGCSYATNTSINAQEVGGTSASSPAMAGIMALIVQKQGGAWQGLANPPLYALARKQNYSNCNSNTNSNASSTCFFNDIVDGTIAQVCTTGSSPDCVTGTSGDTYGVLSGYNANVGYDMATGLGSLNVANVVNGWSSVINTGTPAVTLSPATVTFPGTTVVGATDATTETITIKNTGTASVGFTNFTITGAGQNSFNLSSSCPGPGSTLAVGASCPAVITFVPQAVGTQTATMTVSDNAGSQTATLTGVGASANAPAVTLTPTSIAFASTPEGGETAAQLVTVKNSGTAALAITSIAVAGTNPTDFLKTATTCTSSLAAGASCTVSVAFKPLATGAFAATLAVTDNAAGSPQSVTLTGTGTATAPAVSLTPTALTFAATPEETQTAAQVVTLKNTGSATLDITTIVITGTNLASFVKTATTCGTTLTAGSSCTISVAMKPIATGALTATLEVIDNATGTPQTVKLTGTGTSVTAPVVSLTPTSIAFGAENIGVASATQPVTVKNIGTATLNLTGVTLTGTNPTSFVDVTNTCGTTLTVGSSCVVLVEMKPAVAGALTANLSFADNAAGTPQVVKLSGTGNAPLVPIITLSATALAYPNTIVGTTSDAQILTVKNTGGAAATLSKIALAGTNPTDFELLNGCGTTLPASGYCYVYVAFKPATAAAFTATVSITDNAAGSPQAVKLTGTGTADPTIKLSATTLAFPTTTHGTVSAPVAVTVTNSGTSAVELTSITISGTNATSFTEINTCSATLAAAASCTVYVAFAPTTTGALTAKLAVNDTGVFSPQSVTLTGTGK